MRIIRKGYKGEDVEKWQHFLVGEGLLRVADGDFGANTETATITFQKKYKLLPDGIVGNKTIGVAMQLGFDLVEDQETDETSANWPAPPAFKSLSQSMAEEVFGKFQFVPDPEPRNPERIKILDDWREKNIIKLYVPQLKGIKTYGTSTSTGYIYFHKKAAQQMLDLWAAWEKDGLLKYVIQWSGTYSARLIRGSQTRLSNHAFGTAFDINVFWNGLGKLPALLGKEGSVRKLVPLANKYGFFWGGHFPRRPDGMHFEVAKVL